MLVTCPECGETISEDANPCPYCGKSYAGPESEESEIKRKKEHEEWEKELELEKELREEKRKKEERAARQEKLTRKPLSISEVRRLRRRGIEP